MTKKSSVGTVQTKFFTFAESGHGLKLECGDSFGPITLAYETYGSLNDEKSNAVLVLHALSGDAHAAGFLADENKPGWWDNFIGPGKALDTGKYYVICSNILGGCQGSTGPGSVCPVTGKPYGHNFPLISIGDMVECQRHLIDYLGIDKLLSVIGGSMGGMQVLEWLGRYSDRIHSAIPIACAMKHSPQQIAFNEVARQSIMADPNWSDGNYYDKTPPTRGLSLARMIGHITYMSDKSMMDKFGRQKKDVKDVSKFTANFEVEGYLRYRGDSFVKRFDANSFLYITKAMDNFDLIGTRAPGKIFNNRNVKVLSIAFKSDWLYPAYQSKEIVKLCKIGGVPVSYCEIDSTYGHDAFLLEEIEESHLISHFLKNVYKKGGE